MLLFIDAPEIEVERPFVHTGVGHEAQLICVVHAEPSAHIIWYKESTQLGTTEQLSQQVKTFFYFHICTKLRKIWENTTLFSAVFPHKLTHLIIHAHTFLHTTKSYRH